MWLSSFAADAALEQHMVRARVWSVRSSSLTPADDVLTLVATSDVSLLRRLRVVHDSFVTLRFQERSHVARLRLLPKPKMNLSEEEQEQVADDDADVTLSPLLAFNLGIPLHSSSANHVVTVSVSPEAQVMVTH